ncbi:MAG: phosphatase PAP2 family protein [Candidatus Heimdallarchaeaceae archaeon]
MKEGLLKYYFANIQQNLSNVKDYFQPYLVEFRDHVEKTKFEGKAIYMLDFLFILYLFVIALLGRVFVVRINIMTILLIFGILIISVIMYKVEPIKFKKPFSLLLDFSPFIFIWLSYDSLAIVQEKLIYPRVHTTELYNLDMKLFSWMLRGLSPNEWFATTFSSLTVDVVFGFTYILHTVIPFIIIVLMLLGKDRKNIRFTVLSFSIVSLISFITYVVFPAAAPWYIAQYGFNSPSPNISYSESVTAGLSRIDELLGISLFQTVYSFESNSFASLPSVHAAYAMSAALCAYNKWKKKSLIFTAPYVFAILFGAIYFYHHFVIDLIVGVAYSLIAHFLTQKIVKKASNDEKLFLK